MKRRFSKILGVGLTLALLTSLLMTAAPVSALTAPSVTFATAGDAVISEEDAEYIISFNLGKELVRDRLHFETGPTGGSAAWSDVENHTTAGTYSALLSDGGVGYTNDDAYGAGRVVIPEVNLDLSSLVTPGDLAYSFNYDDPDTTGYPYGFPYMILAIDSSGGTTIDGWIVLESAGTWDPDEGEWVDWDTSLHDEWLGAGAASFDNTGVADGSALADFATDGDLTSAKVVEVKVAVGEWHQGTYDAITAYVDDIFIEGSTYNLETKPDASATSTSITITFPVGTTVDPTIVAKIVASPGWIGEEWDEDPGDTTGITFAGVAATRKVTFTFGKVADQIGEGATVRINITAGITNPPTAGSYNLTVKTSKETTAVTSAAYSITTPTILPLAGVVERYNSAGVLMEQTNIIQTAITNASKGDTIRVGPGTYDEDLLIDASITLIGDAATTIIKDTDKNTADGMVTISFKQTPLLAGVVFDGFTVMGDLGGAPALTITGIGVTVQNCVFTKAGTATSAVAQTMVIVAPTAAADIYGNTITNCTFDTTLGATQDTGIDVRNGFGENTTISNCTFLVDAVTVGTTEDTAIKIADGIALKPVKVIECTISGASGNGIVVTLADTVAKITDSTLSNLSRALSVTSGTVTVSGCTIDTCGLAKSATLGITAQAAIDVVSTAGLSITNNTITNCPNDIIEIALSADSSKVNMMFNNLTDNALGIDNNDGVVRTLNATHNWWGVATGPAADMNVEASATLGQIDTTSYLGSEATGSFALGSASLITKTTVGVDVAATLKGIVKPAIIGVANYAANPQDATPLPALDGGFYDVYLAEVAAGDTTSVLIKFYNANVTVHTTVYIWGTIAGGWQLCATQGVNLYGGYAYATVDPANLAGTPFALVAGAAAAIEPPEILTPVTGDDTVSLTPIFAWGAVPEADGYYFQLADNANFVTPMVSLTGDLGRLIVTAYAYVTELPYSTPYYWRVKAVSGTIEAGDLAESAWASGVFITMAEPVEPIPPIVVEEAPPVVIETIEPPTIKSG